MWEIGKKSTYSDSFEKTSKVNLEKNKLLHIRVEYRLPEWLLLPYLLSPFLKCKGLISHLKN